MDSEPTFAPDTMIVPRYWAESKAKKIVNGRSFSLRRLGWSDTAEDAAQQHANARLNEAISILERDGDVRQIDHKTSYNGAEGVPIREEVVSKHQDVVISRNGYGALCLNTPGVLFSDVDFEYEGSFGTFLVSCLLTFTGISFLTLDIPAWIVWGAGVLVAITLMNPLHRIKNWLSGGVEKQAISRIRQVSEEHPELNMRVYRTPRGMRVLVMNRIYSPTSTEALALLEKLDTDRLYTLMCKNQNCFRARVSPKPWRMGMVRLRTGIWPIKLERMAEHRAWVEQYHQQAAGYSSCRYLFQLGSSEVHEKAEFVRQLHDDLCRASDVTSEIA